MADDTVNILRSKNCECPETPDDATLTISQSAVTQGSLVAAMVGTCDVQSAVGLVHAAMVVLDLGGHSREFVEETLTEAVALSMAHMDSVKSDRRATHEGSGVVN